jgi:hypothetical protein
MVSDNDSIKVGVYEVYFKPKETAKWPSDHRILVYSGWDSFCFTLEELKQLVAYAKLQIKEIEESSK